MDSFRSSKVQTLEGFPIRTSTDQGILAPPRGLSQLYTSFIGCQYQGIHRKLFVALPVANQKAPEKIKDFHVAFVVHNRHLLIASDVFAPACAYIHWFLRILTYLN